MKNKNSIVFVLFALFSMLSLSSCVYDQCMTKATITRHIPIYRTYDQIRHEIKLTEPRELKDEGRMYFYENYFFLNERNQGIHVFDNSNPSNPVNLGFIHIEGNQDIVVRNDVIFADNFTDIISINIQDITNPYLMCRTENAFPELMNSNQGMLVGYDIETTEEMVSCDMVTNSNGVIENDFSMTVNNSNATTSGNRSGGSEKVASGLGGSTQKFALADDLVYIIREDGIHCYQIEGTSCMAKRSEVNNFNGEMQTIFAYEDYLFVGMNNGMSIYNFRNNPENPTYVNRFNHAEACDPVFVHNDIAYVTLRTGTSCNGFVNLLYILDVSNINNITQLGQYNMRSPRGLFATDDYLFVCEGGQGFTIFDNTNPALAGNFLLRRVGNLNMEDVIAFDNEKRIVFVGEDGFHQYDYRDINNINLLSTIPTH